MRTFCVLAAQAQNLRRCQDSALSLRRSRAHQTRALDYRAQLPTRYGGALRVRLATESLDHFARSAHAGSNSRARPGPVPDWMFSNARGAGMLRARQIPPNRAVRLKQRFDPLNQEKAIC